MNLTVVVDEKSGVCGGVKRAIKLIEKDLMSDVPNNSREIFPPNNSREIFPPNNSREIFVNGELLHNRLEMERLFKMGLKLEEDVSKINNSSIFIRTHGVSKKVIEEAETNNRVVDATCPKVSKSQGFIEDFHKRGWQIVIVGKKKHPEIIGLLGYCNDEAICVMEDKDLETIDFSKKTAIFAQTTVAHNLFNHFIDILNDKIERLEVVNTICSFVEKREEELIGFALAHDVVVFIGGKNSSNTKVMFNRLSKFNDRSYQIENQNEIDFNWFKDNDIIGVSGSASTPLWQIEEIKNIIDDFAKRN